MTNSYTWEITRESGNSDTTALLRTDGSEAENRVLKAEADKDDQADTYTVKLLNTITLAKNGEGGITVFPAEDAATDT